MKLTIYGLIIQLLWLVVLILNMWTELLDFWIEILGMFITMGYTILTIKLFHKSTKGGKRG